MLKDNLDDILLDYEFNISPKGEDILKKLVDDEGSKNYKNLLFKSGNPAISNYDFYKRFGTLYGLLIYLLNEKISFRKADEPEQDEPHKFIYKFTGKLNLKNPNKNMALANLSIYYTWKNIKSEYNNNNFKITTAPT